MDKKLAKEFVARVSPLEHSTDPRDRKAARVAEAKLGQILGTIPEPRGHPTSKKRKRTSDDDWTRASFPGLDLDGF